MDTHQALEGRVAILKPKGRILGGDETDKILDAAKGLAMTGNLALLVDLDDVEYVNSLGLGVFTRIVVAYSKVHGSVKVCNVHGRVRNLFDIVKFSNLFKYYESELAALEAFSKEMVNPV